MSLQGDAREWVCYRAEGFLRRVGMREGQTVLDFGCNKGNYAKAAAEVVGPDGRVYALDKNEGALDDLAQKAEQEGLRNLTCLRICEDGGIPLPSRSVDVVLLYDIVHRGYFPEPEQREHVLRSVHRVLKPHGLLSLYPTHLKQYGMTLKRQMREVKKIGFELRDESRKRLVHDDNLVRARVFTFQKQGGNSRERRRARPTDRMDTAF